jgi:DEAD/DEAH box helicase domain-containing protein
VPPRNIPLKAQQAEDPGVFADIDFSPNIFIYDNYPGGIGLSPSLFDIDRTLLDHGLQTILACPCRDGCPSCVGPARETGKQAKQVAREILEKLLGEEEGFGRERPF